MTALYKYKVHISTADPIKFLEAIVEYSNKGATVDKSFFPRYTRPYTSHLLLSTTEKLNTTPYVNLILTEDWKTIEELEKLNWVEFGEYMKVMDVKVTNKPETYKRYFEKGGFTGEKVDTFLKEIEERAAAKNATLVVAEPNKVAPRGTAKKGGKKNKE